MAQPAGTTTTAVAPPAALGPAPPALVSNGASHRYQIPEGSPYASAFHELDTRGRPVGRAYTPPPSRTSFSSPPPPSIKAAATGPDAAGRALSRAPAWAAGWDGRRAGSALAVTPPSSHRPSVFARRARRQLTPGAASDREGSGTPLFLRPAHRSSCTSQRMQGRAYLAPTDLARLASRGSGARSGGWGARAVSLILSPCHPSAHPPPPSVFSSLPFPDSYPPASPSARLCCFAPRK